MADMKKEIDKIKKKNPKLKFPQMDVGKPIPKIYAKGSTSRKVDSVD